MWSATGRVKAYWVSVSRFIFTTPFSSAVAISCVGGAGAAVEDEVEGGLLAELRADALLEVLQQLGAQHDVARLVDAVHVAEGGGQQVAALLAQAEGLGRTHRVVDGRVQLVVDLVA